ncbi:MAG: carboxypeptidase regulatory-like domain-containing protein, partial [Acidobacteriaceae bacterium]|nr:carboxypeptidase regulatory-like domain-containing protein [Acidobacteriaceae bacterium]
MRPYRCTFISGVVLILAATFFPLKAQVITATISGTVSDSSGGVVPEARVTARDVSTGLEQNTNTGADGQFTLPFLPVGTYTLRVEHAGFKTFVREGISLSVNQIASIDAQLEVGSTSDTIHVEGNASLVSTDTAQISGVVDSKRIVELPLNGRNVLQLTQLMPGVAYVNTPQSFATA